MISQMLGLFVNTLIACGKDSFSNRENLPQPIQMQLSKKQRHFCQSFLHFRN